MDDQSVNQPATGAPSDTLACRLEDAQEIRRSARRWDIAFLAFVGTWGLALLGLVIFLSLCVFGVVSTRVDHWEAAGVAVIATAIFGYCLFAFRDRLYRIARDRESNYAGLRLDQGIPTTHHELQVEELAQRAAPKPRETAWYSVLIQYFLERRSKSSHPTKSADSAERRAERR